MEQNDGVGAEGDGGANSPDMDSDSDEVERNVAFEEPRDIEAASSFAAAVMGCPVTTLVASEPYDDFTIRASMVKDAPMEDRGLETLDGVKEHLKHAHGDWNVVVEFPPGSPAREPERQTAGGTEPRKTCVPLTSLVLLMDAPMVLREMVRAAEKDIMLSTKQRRDVLVDWVYQCEDLQSHDCLRMLVQEQSQHISVQHLDVLFVRAASTGNAPLMEFLMDHDVKDRRPIRRCIPPLFDPSMVDVAVMDVALSNAAMDNHEEIVLLLLDRCGHCFGRDAIVEVLLFAFQNVNEAFVRLLLKRYTWLCSMMDSLDLEMHSEPYRMRQLIRFELYNDLTSGLWGDRGPHAGATRLLNENDELVVDPSEPEPEPPLSEKGTGVGPLDAADHTTERAAEDPRKVERAPEAHGGAVEAAELESKEER